MGRPNNELYPASGEMRSEYAMPNVDRLLRALHRWPGITEISLSAVFSPGDFFKLSDYRYAGVGPGTPMTWTYRIAEVIRTAVSQGLVRSVPTSHPDYTSYYATDMS